MKTEQVPFTVIEWESEPVTEVPGKSGDRTNADRDG